MGRYTTFVKREVSKSRHPHPIWRGFGCLIMLIVPVLSYAIAYLTLPILYQQGLVPPQLTAVPRIPNWLWYAPVLAQGIQFVIGQPNFYAMALVTFLYIVVLGGLLSFVYALIYRLIGPSRYGPLDAPPPKGIKVKKHTR